MRKLPVVGPQEEKTLMPEVLPSPPPAGAAGSPRDRTVRHMRKLLAAAAVAGVAATTTRSHATDAGPDDASTEAAADGAGDDGASGDGAITDGARPGDAGEDAADAGMDVRPGYDPPPDYDVRPGYDPAGPPPGSGESSGCGCDVVGKK